MAGLLLSLSGQPGSIQVVTAGMGGVVTVLDGATGAKVAASDDLGLGGMALEVVDLDGQAPDEILFAPCYNAMDHAGTPLRTRLYVLRHNPATNKLDVVAAAVLGVANSDLVGYGASALRVANLNGDATRHVIVATLNGELTVFEWDASGQTLGSRVFSLVTEGSLGGYGAMLVQDLDPANGLRPEIYLATSSGIRKWRIP